ncbi:MAG: replication initiator protein [Microvirus sp.]|nr:MAG: replication initiator protein [Microvirus sp.]
MPCFKPIDVPRKGFVDLRVTVPCGGCIGCRLEKARQWATRITHEAQLHSVTSFVTLTYDTEHLPPGGSLRPRDFVLFMKRLRKNLGSRIRFFHCGEYGDDDGRPHYHAIFFGYMPGDLEIWTQKKGHELFTSASLDKIWGHGQCFIGQVTHKSAAYVAKYTLKKITGDIADTHYRRIDPETGETFQLHPEYATMSRRPGIGSDWFTQYRNDVYPRDYVVAQGKITGKPPAFYDRILKRDSPELHDRLKAMRVTQASAPDKRANQTPARLAVRETVKRASLSLYRRNKA